MGSRLNMGVVLKNSRSVLMVDCIDQHVQIGLVPSWEMLTVFVTTNTVTDERASVILLTLYFFLKLSNIERFWLFSYKLGVL
jgi:hypothetical protein